MDTVIILDKDNDSSDFLKCIQHELKVVHYKSAEEFFSSKDEYGSAIFLICSNLSGIQCPEVVKAIRYSDKCSHIIILAETEDSVGKSLENGADTFILKPYDLNLLVLILNNSIKKTHFNNDNSINIGIRLLPGAKSIIKDGKVVSLTSSEYQIMEKLLGDKNKTNSRQELADEFKDNVVTFRTIDVHMCSLRKKVEVVGITIKTIRGEGYKIA